MGQVERSRFKTRFMSACCLLSRRTVQRVERTCQGKAAFRNARRNVIRGIASSAISFAVTPARLAQHGLSMNRAHGDRADLRRTGLKVCCSASSRFRLHERRSNLTLTRILCISIGVRTAKLRGAKSVEYLRTSNSLPTHPKTRPLKYIPQPSSRCAVKRAAPFTATRWVTLRTFNPKNLCRSGSKFNCDRFGTTVRSAILHSLCSVTPVQRPSLLTRMTPVFAETHPENSVHPPCLYSGAPLCVNS